MLKKVINLSFLFIIGSSVQAHFAQKAMHVLHKHGSKKFQELITHRFKFNQIINQIDYEKLSLNKSKEVHICDLQAAYADLNDLTQKMIEDRTMPTALKKIVASRIGSGLAALGATAYASSSIDQAIDTPFSFTTAGTLVGVSFLNSAAQGYKEETIERKNAVATVRTIEKNFNKDLRIYLIKVCKYNPGVARTLAQRIIKK